MKKLIAIVLALIVAFFGATTGTTLNGTVIDGIAEDITITDTTAAYLTDKAYKARCSKYTPAWVRVVKRAKRHGRAIHMAKLVLLLPLIPILGAFPVSYKKDDEIKTKSYTDYVDALLAYLKIPEKYKPEIREVRDLRDPETVARESEIGFIRKIHLSSYYTDHPVVEFIPFSYSSLKRKLKKMGLKPYDVFMKIDAHTSEFDEEGMAAARAEVTHITADKFVDRHGCAWKPCFCTAGEKRKGVFTCVREDLYPVIGKWLMCGLNTRRIRMVVSKYLVYLGLQASASKPMMEVFGWTFDFHRIAIIPDLNGETKTPRDCWFVDAAKRVFKKKNHKEPLNVFDGAAFYFKNKFVNKTFSFRFGAWTKGCCAPLDREQVRWFIASKKLNTTDKKTIRAWLKDHGSEITIKTIDGEVKIDDIDVIMTESTWKCKGQYASVREWADACIENEYEFNVCIQQHRPKLKSLPYQQGQLIRGNSTAAIGMASHAAAYARKLRKPEEAASILPGWMGEMAEMLPSMFKVRYILMMVQRKYTKIRNEMISGKIPEAGYSLFVMPDPVAFVCHAAGLPIECSIEENECVCTTIENGKEVVLTRNPDTDGCPILKNKNEGMFCAKDVVYINPFSWVPILLRLDYDGDHVFVIVYAKLVDLYKITKEEVGEIPIIWVAPSGVKTVITVTTIGEAILASITGSKTGIHSDNITKILNISKEDRERLIEEYGEEVLTVLWAIETKAVNVEIDAAKNAAEVSQQNDEMEKLLRELSKLKLPEFCRYSKASKEHPADDEEYWSRRTAYTGSFLDMYSRTVRKQLPETLEIQGLDDKPFDVTLLMIDPHRQRGQYRGLCLKGKWDPETQSYINVGLFNHIARRLSSEWKLIIDKEVNAHKENYKDSLRAAAIAEITRFVEAQGGTLEGAYDIITRYVFTATTSMSDEAYETLMRAYWDIFGQMAYSVLCMNLNEVPENWVEGYVDEEAPEA